MQQNKRVGRGGFTIIEVIISVGLLSLALVATIVLLTTMINLWTKGYSGTSANSYASLAMRRLVLEMEEGQSATMLDTATDPDTGATYGRQLQVTFPYRASPTSDYSKGTSGSVVTYYLSGSTGSESSGTYLWKSVGGTKTRLARNIEIQSLKFYVTNGRLVRINIIGYDQAGAAYSPNLIQQSVKLRNS